MIYLQLLLSYLKIGFFGFGGGYAMLSLIQNEIVVQRGWLTSEQLTDIIAISQVTPGPIAINSATYVGYAVTGTVWGAALATLAACIPSLTLMLAATKFYLRLRANRYVSGAMEGMKPMMGFWRAPAPNRRRCARKTARRRIAAAARSPRRSRRSDASTRPSAPI